MEFSRAQDMLHRAVNPFLRKGSPEDCQIVLQLAVLLGRVAQKSALQAYCDAHLGLDCNGFVGNYIFRVLRGCGWRTDAPDGAVGPSSTITHIMTSSGGFAVDTVDEMLPNRIYALAEVNAHNNIIAGGPSSAPGHIVITEPGRYMNSFMTMDLDLANSGALGNAAFWGSESTGGVGLVQSWYVITHLRSAGKPVDGVFRGSERQFLNFRIRALT